MCNRNITNCTWGTGGKSLQIISHTRVVQTGSAHQLQGREVFFPPQILLHVGADGRQAVVGVHDDVNEGVQQADEERCRQCTKSHSSDK